MARALEKSNIRCSILHGGKTQDQRELSLQGFRDGSFQVLVATDVAGRGLDIPDVTHVLNYDMPNKIENYCHRIGRTGRAGKEVGMPNSRFNTHLESVVPPITHPKTNATNPNPCRRAWRRPS